jgi:pentatricopeptide repeat protein
MFGGFVWLLLAWELLCVSLAAFFPVAMLELSFSMLAVPVLLVMISPKQSVGSTAGATSSLPEVQDPPTVAWPQSIEISAKMRSLLSCLALIFAINLLPLVVQVSPGLIESCTVVLFVVLGHLLLSKNALIQSHLQQQKMDPSSKLSDEPDEIDIQEDTASKIEVAADVEETVGEPEAEELAPEKGSEEISHVEEVALEKEETNEHVEDGDDQVQDAESLSNMRKLVWADVEEDEFQQAFAKRQPEYMLGSQSPIASDAHVDVGNVEGKGKKGKGGGKGGKGGKGFKGGKGEGERSAAAQYTAKIRACGRNGDLQGALEAVEESLAAGVQNSTDVQNALLHALVNCGEEAGSSAADLFEKMKEGKQADVVSFNIMLRSHLHAGDHDKAKELLHDMASHGLSANRVTLNELLSDRVKAGDHAGMWRVLDEMRATGFGITNVACSLMLKSLHDGASKSDVKQTLALMEELAEPMDEALCSSAVEACLRVKELDLASEFMAALGDIKGKNKNMNMSPATYGSMIKAHGQARNLEKTWETWNTMFQNGTIPSAVTFGCMVEALVMNDAVDEAWKLMHDMLSKEDYKECVNTVTFSTVMKGFAHARKPNQCFAVLDEMHARGVVANTITYNTLLDACAKCNAMARVPEVFEEMKRGHIEPDKITYSTLIKGYCMVGELDCAFDLFTEMRQDGKVGLDEIVYNALIDGCGRQQKVGRALQVLADMKEAKIAPSNYTLSILVKLLGRAHKLNEAIALVEDFQANHKVRPNVQVYTCLMQACLLNKRVSQALTTYNKMVTEMRCLPDQKAYSVLLQGCMHAGALVEAVQVARCAYLLPGKDLLAPPVRGHCTDLETHVVYGLDNQIRAADMEADLLADWAEVMDKAGCTPGGGAGKSFGKGSPKGKGKSSGKGNGKGNGKDNGKDNFKGKDGKGSGKSKGKSKGKGKDTY